MRNVVRYSNRKLYDLTNSRYVTLDEIASAVRAGEDITVTEKYTGTDITAATLLLAMHSEHVDRMGWGEPGYTAEALVGLIRGLAPAKAA